MSDGDRDLLLAFVLWFIAMLIFLEALKLWAV